MIPKRYIENMIELNLATCHGKLGQPEDLNKVSSSRACIEVHFTLSSTVLLTTEKMCGGLSSRRWPGGRKDTHIILANTNDYKQGRKVQ